MKKFFTVLFLLLGILGLAYFLGPKPTPPVASNMDPVIVDDLQVLDSTIKSAELATKGLKPDNEARIIWADSLNMKATKDCFLYIHGFSASQEEGVPVAPNVAKQFKANIYLHRLPEHGIDLGDSTMKNFKAQHAIESAEKALVIAKKIGARVHIMGTSFGGALCLYLASKHPEIASVTLYSPCVKVFDPNAELLDNPWGHKLAQVIKGSDYNDIIPKNADQGRYWTLHYRLEAVVELQNFLTTFMNADTFGAIKCPVFLGYFYKNEEEQDKVVSVPALLEMYDRLGSRMKTKEAFVKVNNHVLGSWVLSEDISSVQKSTIKFLNQIIIN